MSTSITQEMNTITLWNQETFDLMTAYDIGVMDATDDFPFAPELYFARHFDMCQYAAGFASVRGDSYLTDGFLVARETPAIEDDHEFIRRGGA